MAYDEELAHRIRAVIGARAGVTEQRMFGGLAFLVGGHMALAASGKGGIMVRVPPEETGSLLTREHVGPMHMRGRDMTGWLRVSDDGLASDEALAEWVDRGIGYGGTLPPK